MPEWLLSDNKIQRLNETVQYALRNSAQTRTAPENDSKPSSPQTAAWLNKKLLLEHMTFVICPQHQLCTLLFTTKSPSTARTNITSIYCKCNLPTHSCYCIFPVNTLLIQRIRKRLKKHSEQAEALLKMSCTIDTLSSMYYAPNDDDTWLVRWWGIGTHLYKWIASVVWPCSSADKVDNW